MANVAIHGFGRIGRTALRLALERKLFVPISVSDIRDAATLAALFAVDTNYGASPRAPSGHGVAARANAELEREVWSRRHEGDRADARAIRKPKAIARVSACSVRRNATAQRACERALSVRVPGGPRRKYIDAILKKGLDQQPHAPPPTRGVAIDHENVRGAEYYDGKDSLH